MPHGDSKYQIVNSKNMKEISRENRELDIFDRTFLGMLESTDFLAVTIKETIKNVDRLQRMRKGGAWYAKA